MPPEEQSGHVSIVKVQIAFSDTRSSGAGRPTRGLVYAEGRAYLIEQELPARVVDLVMSRLGRKAYFTAVWVAGRWEVNDLTTDQPW